MAWLKRLGWGVAGLALLWLAAWAGVPPLVKWQVQTRLSEALGRAVTIDAIRFEPQRLVLGVDGLRIGGTPLATGTDGGPATTAPPLLQIDRLQVDADLASLWQRAPVLESVKVAGLALRVARTGDGHYDIDDLIARFTPAGDAPAGEPLRFALYNLQLQDARITFDDRPIGRVHEVSALRLDLPFVSNLPAKVEVKVEPRLAFTLGATRFDTGAQATPFARTRAADVKLTMGRLDLAPYLAYLPASLPVRLRSGHLGAELDLRFAAPEKGDPTLSLRGQVKLDGVDLADRAGADLLGWQTLTLGLKDVAPWARQVALSALAVEGARVQVRRDAGGQLNWAALAGPSEAASPAGKPAQARSGSASAAPRERAASATTVPAPAPGPAWRFSLERLVLDGATVVWQDRAVTPAAALALDGLSLHVDQIAWPLEQTLPVRLAATLRPGAGGTALGRLAVEGRAGLQEARLSLDVGQLSLAALGPYLAQALVPQLSGELTAQGELHWATSGARTANTGPASMPASGGASAPAAGRADEEQLRLGLSTLTLDRLRLAMPGSKRGTGGAAASAVGPELASVRQLTLGDLDVDLAARRVNLGRLALQQPSFALARGADGRWNVEDWVVAPAGAALPPPASARPPATAEAPWRIALKDLQLQGGRLWFSDAQAGPGRDDPWRLSINGLRVGLQNLAWPAARGAAPMRTQLAASLGPAPGPDDPRPASGTLDWKGQVGLAPLTARGTLKIVGFPVAHFEPSFGGELPLALVRAQAGYQGELNLQQAPAGWTVATLGDVVVADVQLNARQADRAVGEELLNWQRLALDGLSFSMQPGTKPRLEVREAALSDFYSRLVITEQGRFNLQDVAAAPPATAASGPEAAASTAPPAPVAASAPTPAASATPGSGLPIDLAIGGTRLVNGRIDFTDRFVRPNYSAALSELNGRLGAFRSGTREMATLELRGRAAGTALLDISGQLNPTAEPLALDIRAKATDLELAPLSPYAGKYAGYAIERGKLSMDVTYKIDPDGKLDAKNQVVLNQLTFGERIESPQATKLPVLLAVALLKDRHGVIDIDLPVSGSINDPQFSVGGIILKVIVNLLVKALTAPFALLAGGGSDDLSLVEFAPGTSRLAGAGGAALDKVAKALSDRPALKMTVTGAADPASEAEAWRREALEARLIAERRRELTRAGTPAEGDPTLSAADRERLLRLVYKQTELPNKPKNLIGMAKDLPPAEMENLLKAGLRPGEDAMRELALQRGLAVRDALIARGLPSERLFLAAPKLRAAGEGEAAWKPQVQLSLSTN